MRALIKHRILMTRCQILSLTNCIHIGPQGLRGLCKDGGRGVPDAATQHQLPSDRRGKQRPSGVWTSLLHPAVVRTSLLHPAVVRASLLHPAVAHKDGRTSLQVHVDRQCARCLRYHAISHPYSANEWDTRPTARGIGPVLADWARIEAKLVVCLLRHIDWHGTATIVLKLEGCQQIAVFCG